MEIDLKKDLAILTTASERVFTKLIEKISWCICDGVEKARLSNENTVEVNLGFGTLLLNISDDEVKYKFKPSKKFEEALTETIVNNKNYLVDNIEEALVEKMVNVYKNLF